MGRKKWPEDTVEQVATLLDELPKKFWKELLNRPLVLPLEVGRTYSRLQDDHDGTREGRLSLTLGQDNDCWLRLDSPVSLRFRVPMPLGGGRSPRVWNILRLLMLAIHYDGQERPDPVDLPVKKED